MQLFDTQTRRLKTVEPRDGKVYGFYCCGPTVYGPAHIGNFRTFVLQDVFRRTLEMDGVKTMHVRNITDVDDKTIRGSLAAGQTLKDFTEGWKVKFHHDCDALGCLAPHVEPSAVEHIPHQIKMIEELVAKEHAYQSDDQSVYFKISSDSEYGKLSRLDERELNLGATQNQRADSDEYEKDSIADFVLWKTRREEDGDNFWESPWGQGRPGWHLECSAMIREYLGETFDLHSGGVDLVFPHHENEMAQSRCACGGEFAGHWFHITHLMVDGGKMSKSLGNLYTLNDLEKKGYTPAEVRYVLIGAHYRKQLNFTLDSLHAAREALHKLSQLELKLKEQAGGIEVLKAEELSQVEELGVFTKAFEKLKHDLNTQAAIGELFTQLRTVSKLSLEDAKLSYQGLHVLLYALGLDLPKPELVPDAPEEVLLLAQKRWEAKQAQDWAAADDLRNQILSVGWIVKDSKEGFDLIPQ